MVVQLFSTKSSDNSISERIDALVAAGLDPHDAAMIVTEASVANHDRPQCGVTAQAVESLILSAAAVGFTASMDGDISSVTLTARCLHSACPQPPKLAAV